MELVPWSPLFNERLLMMSESPFHILLVEDDASVREAVAAVLRRGWIYCSECR